MSQILVHLLAYLLESDEAMIKTTRFYATALTFSLHSESVRRKEYFLMLLFLFMPVHEMQSSFSLPQLPSLLPTKEKLPWVWGELG
jgi:hypothetical protein